MYSIYEDSYIEAYVFLELYGVKPGGSYEFIDEEGSTETNSSASYAYSDVVITGDNIPYFDFSASSWHTGAINDESVSDYLTAGC